jgi:2-hydroxy-6-oxonona-2,4-dienedioate hydrolase
VDSAVAAPSPTDEIACVAAGAETRFTPCADGQMIWRLWGRPDATPLVLMHGGYGSWMHWIKVIPALSQRYRVLAPDTPGLGESATVPKPYTPDSIAAIVSRGLDAVLPRRRFHLAGFSFGAIVGGPVCRLQGERAISFTMIGAGAMGLRRQQTEALGKREPGMTAAQIYAQQKHNLEIFMISDPARIDHLAVHIQTVNTAQARTQSRIFARGTSLADTLPHLKARIHALWGDRDVTALPYWEERYALLRSIRPDMPIRLLPGIGHWAAYEGPELVVAALAELIGE